MINSSLHISAINYAKAFMQVELAKREADPNLYLQKITSTRGVFTNNSGFFIRVIFDYAFINGQKPDSDAWVDLEPTNVGFKVLPPPAQNSYTLS